MAEYISREDYCEENCGKENREGYKTCKNCCMLNVPSADVQSMKHGRWYECYTDSHHYSGVCTVCGKASIRSINENPLEYCPKCSARMDGGIDG